MLFVIDTNILVSALSRNSSNHWVIEAILDEKIEVCINHEILLEYEEVLTKKYSASTASNFLKALQELPSVHSIEVFFNWNLLDDADDNKFVDVAVAAGAAFIVSEDSDFRKLPEIEFPKVGLLRLAAFRDLLENMSQE